MPFGEKPYTRDGKKPPVWIHGDLTEGNILIKDNMLAAIIDFGCMGIGDPACDLAIAWTFFKGDACTLFLHRLALDEETISRAKA